KLDDGIAVGNCKYEYLIHSLSQLQNNSVWMYFQGNLPKNVTDLRNEMGDFSMIKHPGAYASRVSQCWSSTIDAHQTTVTSIPFICVFFFFFLMSVKFLISNTNLHNAIPFQLISFKLSIRAACYVCICCICVFQQSTNKNICKHRNVQMERVKEVCFSDGIGRISSIFAEKVAKKLGLPSTVSAFQVCERTISKKKKKKNFF
ncbi:hypothetical protein RFI_31223, partial [Reticulomyxa filosa]